MRLLCPIVRVLGCVVNSVRHELSMGNTVTSQFICHDLPGLTAMTTQQMLEEPLRSSTVSPRLQININYFTILVYRSPEIVLFAVDLYKDLVNVESVAEFWLPALQAPSIFGSELDAPKAD